MVSFPKMFASVLLCLTFSSYSLFLIMQRKPACTCDNYQNNTRFQTEAGFLNEARVNPNSDQAEMLETVVTVRSHPDKAKMLA